MDMEKASNSSMKDQIRELQLKEVGSIEDVQWVLAFYY